MFTNLNFNIHNLHLISFQFTLTFFSCEDGRFIESENTFQIEIKNFIIYIILFLLMSKWKFHAIYENHKSLEQQNDSSNVLGFSFILNY